MRLQLHDVCRVTRFSMKSMAYMHGPFSVWFLFYFFFFSLYAFPFFFRKQEHNRWVAFTRGKYCAVSVSMGMCKLLL